MGLAPKSSRLEVWDFRRGWWWGNSGKLGETRGNLKTNHDMLENPPKSTIFNRKFLGVKWWIFQAVLLVLEGFVWFQKKLCRLCPSFSHSILTELEECDPVSGSQKEGDERCHPCSYDYSGSGNRW